MNFGQNYRVIGSFDVSKIKSILVAYKEEWEKNKSRQERYKLFHGDSKNIFITDIDAMWDGVGYPLVRHEVEEDLKKHTLEIVASLEQQLGGKVGKSLYINLPAGKKVNPHVDMGYYLSSVHRLHIPIMTHDDVDFFVDGEKFNMKQGTCYELNNVRTHAVDNRSTVDRIHLLVDIMPPHIFKVQSAQSSAGLNQNIISSRN
jgi:Aspartyl/Asparaginyl beta-hydroxylase